MRISLVTDCLGEKSFPEMLEVCAGLGIREVELGCGNWSSAPHIHLDALLESKVKREEMLALISRFGIAVSALNCSGNPLAPGEWGKRDDMVTRKTFRLAQLLEVTHIVMMSGLPAACPDDHYPNWIITSWPPETQAILDYQWNTVAIPYWKGLLPAAREYDITHIALEPHGWQLVYNVENFMRLKDAVGGDPLIGFNLDPSHLFWMGADPLAAVRSLKGMIYHAHVKDVRREKPAETNTLLDGKPVLDFARRSWNFAAPGYGHGEDWWRRFVVELKMAGYDGALSIEHEDYTMNVLDGITRTADMLRRIMV